jgi:hypothetical protein
MRQQSGAQKTKLRVNNAKKARELADHEFPGEKWISIETGIYLSPRRPIGRHSGYVKELRDAQILRDWGSTVYLTPEDRSDTKKKFDAIVNGMKMEFKNMHGASPLTLIDHFLDSREQAPNVFLNLEKSPLTRRQIMNTLYRARNSDDYVKKSKGNSGGRIILKIKGRKNLMFLKIDDLKRP